MATVYTANDLLNNGHYRKVVQTTPHGQIVFMRVIKDEDIPRETHEDSGQFIVLFFGDLRVTTYQGNTPTTVKLGPTDTVFIPAGTSHYISTKKGASLLSIYTSPEHLSGTIHPTQREATKK